MSYSRVLTLTAAGVGVALVTLLPATAAADPKPSAPAAQPAAGDLLKGKTIYLDPTAQTWRIGQLAKAGLESQGAKVVLSYADERSHAPKTADKAKAVKDSKANLALSVATYKATPTQSGYLVRANPAQPTSGDVARQLAASLATSGLTAATPAAAVDGVISKDTDFLKSVTVPAALVEVGNDANKTDIANLAKPDEQVKYALGLTDAALKYLTGAPAPAQPGQVLEIPGVATLPVPVTIPGLTQPAPASTSTTTTVPAPTAPATPAVPATPTQAAVPGLTQSTDTVPPVPTIPNSPTPTAPGAPLDPSLPAGTQGPTSADPTFDPSDIDLSGLGQLMPFVEQILGMKDNPEGIEKLITDQGGNVGSQVLNAILNVLYSVVGGKLPI